jgi:hypothetical protein
MALFLLLLHTEYKAHKDSCKGYLKANLNHKALAGYQTLFPIPQTVDMAEVKAYGHWWGSEIRLKAAVGDVNNLSSAVEGTLGTLALRYPAIALIGGAVAAGVAFRQALHGLVCGDGGIILASPWPIPLMLVPIRSSSNVKEDEMMWTVFS